MAVTKSHILNKVQEETGFSKQDCKRLVNVLLDVITRALAEGNEVRVTNFGKWYISEYKPAKFELFQGDGLPRAEPTILPARRVVKFKYGKKLREELNAV